MQMKRVDGWRPLSATDTISLRYWSSFWHNGGRRRLKPNAGISVDHKSNVVWKPSGFQTTFDLCISWFNELMEDLTGRALPVALPSSKRMIFTIWNYWLGWWCTIAINGAKATIFSRYIFDEKTAMRSSENSLEAFKLRLQTTFCTGRFISSRMPVSE